MFDAADGFLGSDPSLRTLVRQIERVAPAGLPVVVTGETGTGKELVARAIHRRSGRAGPFVAVAAATLSPSLADAELFGHEAGAFTGAGRRRAGLFERARGGTLYVDEVGDLPLPVQGKLLRALQEQAFRPIGGDRSRAADVRSIASTHRDLEALCAAGEFRRDLRYRLGAIELRVPPLRERIGDVPLLAQHFLDDVAAELGRPLSLTEQALDRLLAHGWPGNVRELENVIRAAALLSDEDALGPDALPFGRALRSVAVAPQGALRYEELLDELALRERAYVEAALRRAGGNKAEAARRLGVTRYTLYRTLRRLGVAAPAPREVPA